MLIESGARLLFIGDSITDCGRERPVGEGPWGGLGGGYVTQVDALLGANYPERNIRVTNVGIGGNTIRHLRDRWETDVTALRPDWLSVMIGINDVWRGFDHPNKPELAVPLEEFEAELDGLIARTRPQLTGLVMMTPFYLEPNPEEPLRARMDAFGQAVHRVAQHHQAIFVDVQAAFNRVLAHTPTQALASDRVHPNHVGHMVIAQAFYRSVGGA